MTNNPHIRSGSWKPLALENKRIGNSVSKLMEKSNSACCSKITGSFQLWLLGVSNLQYRGWCQCQFYTYYLHTSLHNGILACKNAYVIGSWSLLFPVWIHPLPCMFHKSTPWVPRDPLWEIALSTEFAFRRFSRCYCSLLKVGIWGYIHLRRCSVSS